VTTADPARDAPAATRSPSCPGSRHESPDPLHLSDRLTGREHHLHRLSPELRAELAAMPGHGTDPLSRESLSKILSTPQATYPIRA
jgi:hypothetical protein